MTTSADRRRTTIEGNDIHSQLERGRETLERGCKPTPEQKKKILKERAKFLAAEPEKEKGLEHYFEVLEFALASERYAIETAYIREVWPLRQLTALPCTPPFVLGIINVRGQTLSVIDLKKFFDLPEKGLTDLNKVIIVQEAGMELGILSDTIIGVELIPFDTMQPSLPTLKGIQAEYVKGVTNDHLVVLDGAKIVSDKKIIVHEEVEK